MITVMEESGGLPETGSPAGRMSILQWLPLLVTIFVGVTVTLVVSSVFRGSERARMRNDFVNMSADRAHAIRAGLAEDFLELDLLASYVAASNELSEGRLGDFAREFERYAARIPAQEPDTQVLGFILQVPGERKAAFEARARREIDPDFSIRELDAGDQLIPARSRAEFLPLTVVVPSEFSDAILGLDVGTIPEFASAIRHCVASGRITASAGSGLPLAGSETPFVWHFLAVSRRSTPTAGAVHGGLIGLAVSAFRIDQMVELALKDLSPAGIDLELTDTKAPAGRQLLYYHRTRAPRYDATEVAKKETTWSTTIDAGERSWKLTAYPTQEFIDRHRSLQPLVVLVGGLLLTAVGSALVWSRLRHALRVELLVTERTRDLALEVAKHEKLERALADSRSTLAGQVDRLNHRNDQVQLLNEVGDMLQSCLFTEEAYPLIAAHAPQLLPGTCGALYVREAGQELYAALAEWGDAPPSVGAIKAEDCWALRRGKVHAVSPGGPAIPCRHAGAPDQSLCVPLAASGKSIGLLHVTGLAEEGHAFAVSMAEHIGLALSNLMLRSDLRQLSIHDPLTGLFNRRYMEETLEIEIRRAERSERPVGLIMLDLDHFKMFNDRFGHAAGDELLRALGDLLRARLRAGDIACRYGGEEFVLILPDAGEEVAVQRAEDIRQHAQALDVRSQDRQLGRVTVSLGVAVHPVHGRTRADLLAAADSALYRAKEAGRDRVARAGG